MNDINFDIEVASFGVHHEYAGKKNVVFEITGTCSMLYVSEISRRASTLTYSAVEMFQMSKRKNFWL